MNGRVSLVTGATGGLGKAIATALAREGGTVVVVGRSEARAEDSIRDIHAVVPNAALEPLACDLSSQASIRWAVEDFHSRHQKLNVLVNAAGVFRKERQVTPDGLEVTFATNVMGYFLLTNLLLDSLKGGAGADDAWTSRVVNIASKYSGGPSVTKIDFDDLQTAKRKYSYTIRPSGWRPHRRLRRCPASSGQSAGNCRLRAWVPIRPPGRGCGRNAPG
jgi:NAD(P)-dependent dehydrogenase (short-subunit alcohol dehydrogenase family)